MMIEKSGSIRLRDIPVEACRRSSRRWPPVWFA